MIGTDIDVCLRGSSSLTVLTPRHRSTEGIPRSTPGHTADGTADRGITPLDSRTYSGRDGRLGNEGYSVQKKIARSRIAEATRYGRSSPGGACRYPQTSNPQEDARATVGVRVARSGPPHVGKPARCSSCGAESSIPPGMDVG